MIKLRNLLFVSAALVALFSACSSEMDEATDASEQGKAEAYASFTFVMPGTTATRATEGTEDGTSEENNITNVKFLLFRGDGTIVPDIPLLTRDAFTPTHSGGATWYTTKEDIAIATAGNYTVHVIVNPTDRFNAIANLADYEKVIETVKQTTGEYCTDNHFLMTNAEGEEKVEITTKNIKDNPAKIEVKVERIAAKITFTSNKENNVYPIKEGTIKFDAYKVINTRNSAFGLRRAGTNVDSPTIGASETLTNYVFDNIFTQKTASFDESVFKSNYSRKYNTYVAFRILEEKANKQPLAYCLENTMIKEAQTKGWSTIVIMRGKITPTEGYLIGKHPDDKSEDLYRYNGQFYATLEDLVKDTDKNWKGNGGEKTTDGITNDVLGIVKNKTKEETISEYLIRINYRDVLYNKHHVEFFVDGYCYYTIPLRHRDNNSEDMGIMEFAIARNNVYQITINNVSKIGSFTSGTPGPGIATEPEKGQADVSDGGKNPEIPGEVASLGEPQEPVIPIDPTDPDESKEIFLNVGIRILPWTVRQNNVDL